MVKKVFLTVVVIVGIFVFFTSPEKQEFIEIEQVFDQANEEKVAVIGEKIGNIIVSKVVDGDTFEVVIDGLKQKVRLLGINTPETVDPRKKVECFGKEASNYLKTLLSNKHVRLEADESQGDMDKYGRLLRYVWLEDGSFFVNLEIIKNGYGYEYTYNKPYSYQPEFKAAQAMAKGSNAGLWAENTCGGQK